MSTAIPLDPARPINEAPVEKDREFGPCLLAVEPDGWEIGHWDGEGWFSDDGFPLRPAFFVLLPQWLGDAVRSRTKAADQVEDFLAAGGLV